MKHSNSSKESYSIGKNVYVRESKKNDSNNYKEEKNIINKCEKHLVMNTKCHTKKSDMI